MSVDWEPIAELSWVREEGSRSWARQLAIVAVRLCALADGPLPVDAPLPEQALAYILEHRREDIISRSEYDWARDILRPPRTAESPWGWPQWQYLSHGSPEGVKNSAAAVTDLARHLFLPTPDLPPRRCLRRDAAGTIHWPAIKPEHWYSDHLPCEHVDSAQLDFTSIDDPRLWHGIDDNEERYVFVIGALYRARFELDTQRCQLADTWLSLVAGQTQAIQALKQLVDFRVRQFEDRDTAAEMAR